MSSLSVGSTAGSPITISGLAAGLNTSSIISALMGAEREPLTRLTETQGKLQAEQTALQSVQSSLHSSRSRPPNSACLRCSKARRRSPPTNPRG